MRKLELKILGDTPCKKSRYRIARGKFYVDKEVHRWENNAIIQIRAHARGVTFTSKRLRCEATFFTSGNRDLDGMLVSVLDVLQKAGVISNDKNFVSFNYIDKISVPEGEEQVWIRIDTSQSGEKRRKNLHKLVCG